VNYSASLGKMVITKRSGSAVTRCDCKIWKEQKVGFKSHCILM